MELPSSSVALGTIRHDDTEVARNAKFLQHYIAQRSPVFDRLGMSGGKTLDRASEGKSINNSPCPINRPPSRYHM